MSCIEIDSLDDPRLAPYRDLTTRNLTRHSGLFIAEGEKVTNRLIDSSYEVVSLLVEPAFTGRYSDRLPTDVPIYVTPRDRMQSIVGFHFHRGVLACGRRRPTLSIDELLARFTGPATIVVCPDVQDPTNLASIIRTAAAFGCGVVLGSQSADPFSRRVLRVSMGAALHLPLVESPDLARDLTQLQEADVEIVAAVLDTTAELLSNAKRGQRLALLFGSEGHGLAPQWLALTHRRVTIPMQLSIDSLNVAVAAAVFLYHFCSDLASGDQHVTR